MGFRLNSKKSRRSLARHAKDNGREEDRRMEGRGGTPHKEVMFVVAKTAQLNYLLIPIEITLIVFIIKQKGALLKTISLAIKGECARGLPI